MGPSRAGKPELQLPGTAQEGGPSTVSLEDVV